MRNILRLGVILILAISLQSCGGSKRVIDSNPDLNPVLTEIDTTASTTDEPIVSNEIDGSRVPSRKSLLDNIKINLNENENFTPMQKRLIKKATGMEEKKVYYVFLEEDGIEVTIVMEGGRTRIMMSIDDVEKINNKYRMAEILEELVEKYNIENELNLTIVESLTNEIVLLNEKVSLLNDELQNKDDIISTLDEVIIEIKESNRILLDVNGIQADVITEKDKEIRKQKRQKVFIAGGAGVVIVLLLLLAF